MRAPLPPGPRPTAAPAARRARWSGRTAAWRRIALALVGALGLGGAGRANAQVVTGRVVERPDDRPMASALVVLLDTTQRRVAGALSDDSGRFVLRAPAAGRYAVRAERVGSVSAMQGPFTLGARDSLDVRLALAPALRLSTVRVTAKEKCRVKPAEGELAARLWDEARKALANAALTDSTGRTLTTRLARVSRQFATPSPLDLTKETWTLAPAPARLFRSPSPEELALHGFVRTQETGYGRDTSTFFAPDAEVLLSEAFLAGHCFRAVAADKERSARGEMGLAFEPVKRDGPRHPDVRGTLWLDGATFELRELEFGYVNLPRELDRDRPGGYLIFGRLPNGAWHVVSWMIRMPTEERRSWERTDQSIAFGYRTQVETSAFPTVREEGGRALTADIARALATFRATVSGAIIDSTEGALPLPDVRVHFDGTPFEGYSGMDGAFYLEAPLVGQRTLKLHHPRAASLGINWETTLGLTLGTALRVNAAIPSRETLLAVHCGRERADSLPLVAGLVEKLRLDPNRVKPPERRRVENAAVDVEWRMPDWPAGWTEKRTVRTGKRGQYLLCDVPPRAEVTVTARADGMRSEARSLVAEPKAVLTADLLVAPKGMLGQRP